MSIQRNDKSLVAKYNLNREEHGAYIHIRHISTSITLRMHLTCVLKAFSWVECFFCNSVSTQRLSLMIGLQSINNEVSIVNCMGIGRQTMHHKSHRINWKMANSMNNNPLRMNFNLLFLPMLYLVHLLSSSFSFINSDISEKFFKFCSEKNVRKCLKKFSNFVFGF